MRVCAEPGCPTLVKAGTRNSRCPAHQRQRDRARGSSTARGYGHRHEIVRAAIQRQIDLYGGIECVTCGTPLTPGMPWDLGHTRDRREYLGPQCIGCNRGHRDPR